MSDTCPNCGYCPHCKKARPAPAPLFPAQYRCTCGAYVTAGTYHACWYSPSYPWVRTWSATSTSGTQNDLGKAGQNILGHLNNPS